MISIARLHLLLDYDPLTGLGKNNTTGVVGVTRFGQKFRATIVINGKHWSLGIHPTVELAAQARAKAEKELL